MVAELQFKQPPEGLLLVFGSESDDAVKVLFSSGVAGLIAVEVLTNGLSNTLFHLFFHKSHLFSDYCPSLLHCSLSLLPVKLLHFTRITTDHPQLLIETCLVMHQ